MLALIVILSGQYLTDSVAFGTGVSLSVTESVGLYYCHESSLSEDNSSSVLISGGPLVHSDSYWESCSYGCAIEGEIRGYKLDDLRGFFVGGSANLCAIWKESEERRESVSARVKFGWKHDLRRYGIPIDIEPNCSAGIMMDNDNDDGWAFTPKPIICFDMKILVY